MRVTAGVPAGEPYPAGQAPTTRIVRLSRLLDAPPARVYRAWSHPEDLARWFPYRIEGSLTVGNRTMLVWPDQRVWWDVKAAEPDRLFVFRWPWLPDDSCVTEVIVRIDPRGYGSTLTLEDGPFDVSDPRILDAYAEACVGWGEALAMLRAYVDLSVDLRGPG